MRRLVTTTRCGGNATAATSRSGVAAAAVPMICIGETKTGIPVDPCSPQFQKWARIVKVTAAGSPGKPSSNCGLQP